MANKVFEGVKTFSEAALVFLTIGVAILSSCEVKKKDKSPIDFSALGDFHLSEGQMGVSGNFLCGELDEEVAVAIEDTIKGDRDLVCALRPGTRFDIGCEAKFKPGHDNWSSTIRTKCVTVKDTTQFHRFTVYVTSVNQAPLLGARFKPGLVEETKEKAETEPEILEEDVNQVVKVAESIKVVDVNSQGDDKDPDGDELHYSCIITGGIYGVDGNYCNVENTPNIKSARGEISWKPLAIHADQIVNEYTVTVTASDQQEPPLEDQFSFTIKVEPISPPIINSFNAIDVAEDGYISQSESSSEAIPFLLDASEHIAEEIRYSAMLLESDPARECDGSITYDLESVPAVKTIPAEDGDYFVCAYLENVGLDIVYAKSQVITRDTVLPEAPTLPTLASYSNSATVEFSWTKALDSSLKTHNVMACGANDCSTDCTSVKTGVDSASLADLVDGLSYFLCVQAVDVAANTSDWAVSTSSMLIDTTVPTDPVVGALSSRFVGSSLAVTWTSGSDDNFSSNTIKACLDNVCSDSCVGETQDSGSSTNLTGFVTGNSYFVCVRSHDAAGNFSAFIASSSSITAYRPGDFDPAFSSDGFVTYGEDAADLSGDLGFTIGRNSEGYYLVGGRTRGSSDQDLAIWKFTSSGVLDSQFGVSGLVTFDKFSGTGGTTEEIRDLKISGDKILITGVSNNRMFLAKLNSDGTLDSSFASSGKYVAPSGPSQGNSLAIADDNSLFVTGFGAGDGQDMYIWKFNSLGILDTGFDDDGIIIHASAAGGSGDDVGSKMFIDASGGLIIVGSSNNGTDTDLVVWRFISSGILDTGTFGSGTGLFIYDSTNGDDFGYDATADSDGNIFIVGKAASATNDDLLLVKLTSQGVLDSDFNTVGYATDNSGAGGDGADDGKTVQVDSSGRVLVGGSSAAGGDEGLNACVWRFTSVGELDTAFGVNGVVCHNNAAGEDSGDDRIHSSVLDNDTFIGVGDSYRDGDYAQDLGLWRLFH